MKVQEFIEILDELITVDTEEGLIEKTSVARNIITVNFHDKTKLTVRVEQD